MKYVKLTGDMAIEDDRHVTLEVGVAPHYGVYLALRFRDTGEGHAVILTPLEALRLIGGLVQSSTETIEENFSEPL